MVAENDQPSIPARRLAERLRDLREREHLTQKQLARILGGSEALSIATISLWEKPGSDRLPPPQRLAAYARLFCTTRSFSGERSRLLSSGELSEQERERERELYDELIALRERAQSTNAAAPARSPRSAIWHFPDPIAVSIVCSDAVEPPPYAQHSHLNYSRYAKYADLDALVEVFGQVKADNPERMIRILPTTRLAQDFALNHLILIGGAASDAASLFAQDIPLPIPEEIPGTDPVTHLFECTVGSEKRKFKSTWEEGTLMQDVGLIARSPHPIIPGGTVTLLSGITSRGVHGAALCFIDSHLRDTNERYLESAFGNVESFCILMNIPVQNDVALPPNLWRENTSLYEWSADGGARWGDRQDEN
ncbi:MAG TPA: helix-turn-helix transcriptional regulator [Streptosporangiaceae bacterium]|nr:helix-turn-helix transcriptional regulator [Streptosporangiaceae bacterium]